MSLEYGPLIRLWGIHSSQLPAVSASPDELTPFLSSILLEAAPFISNVPSPERSPFKTAWQSMGSRRFLSSKSPVYMYNRTVHTDVLESLAQQHHLPQLKGGRLQPEKWYLRRSTHEDSAAPGTARWDEWVKCFKEHHSEAEKEFTPTVLGTTVHQEWDCRDVEVELDGEIWTDWTLKLEESVHQLPPPFKDRVFPVLQATAAVRGGRKFMVVQIAASDLNTDKQRSKTVRGAYTSIERLMETPDGIEWVMATTSDAKGSLPPWMQKMAMPGPVAKDVALFLSWIASQRTTGKTSLDWSGGQATKGKQALAKMTFELSIRQVSAQTDRLQRDLQKLVHSTSQDKEFREQHEVRLQKLWQEMLAVKQHMSQVDGGQKGAEELRADFEKCQQETKSLISEFQHEIKELRELFDGLSRQLDQLPTLADSIIESGYKSQSTTVTRSTLDSQTQPSLQRGCSLNSQDSWGTSMDQSVEELVQAGHDKQAVTDASIRVIETIKSTRRWHRDHKATILSDAEYTASYLKQQSKRDPDLAVRIQKALLRRVRRNRRLANPPPRSLAEFCKDIKWQDVIDTVQDMLVKHEKRTMMEMLKESQ
ncbi:unnamed protein product [Clonostachys rosea f. rosea IK726]|uniref:Uncharacterized protein n=1 Tax=Clonostachys rosea f. rosea IK726 TaxID=1349383 RepID=A0ACA9TBQ4_BIOOC|nr:unnamed protein product [Clonostachys rosea f. rosea IK726]